MNSSTKPGFADVVGPRHHERHLLRVVHTALRKARQREELILVRPAQLQPVGSETQPI